MPPIEDEEDLFLPEMLAESDVAETVAIGGPPQGLPGQVTVPAPARLAEQRRHRGSTVLRRSASVS